MALSVRKLRPDDDRSAFESGDPDLDRFFKRFAGQNQFKHYVGTTYVAEDDGCLLGFATVSAAQIEIRELPASQQGRLPRYPLPVLRLARLAVDRKAQGRGIGLALLKAVLILARAMASDFGCIGVVVDAKPQAIAFYRRYGFTEMDVVQGKLGDRPEPMPMFLAIGAIPGRAAVVSGRPLERYNSLPSAPLRPSWIRVEPISTLSDRQLPAPSS